MSDPISLLEKLAGAEDSGLFYVHNGKLPPKVCCAYCSSSKYVSGGGQLYFEHEEDCVVPQAKKALFSIAPQNGD